MSAATTRSIRLRLSLAWVTLMAGMIGTPGICSAPLDLAADGWFAWTVPAVPGAPAWCCFDWQGNRAANGRCDLDRRNGSYGSDDATVDTMRIYARVSHGVVAQLRALSPSCPVETDTAVTDLGAVDADESARWLERQLGAGVATGTDRLAALAVHAGPVARDALASIARTHDDRESRQDAVFWMGQVRATDSGDIVRSIMFDDADSAMREHAAFALAQSDVAGKADDLIRLGRTDRDTGVRSQAWFWLAQTAAPGTEAAIAQALRTETDDGVREQAIFALSQLPGDRAVEALGAILDDQSRSTDERKRALFWLGQNDSPRAQALLSKVLSGP